MPGGSKKDVLMGIDGGTGSVRVGLYDFSGRCLSFASVDYPTAHPFPGWAEQDPADWWRCLGEASKRALSSAGIDPDRIAAVAADTTCTSVVLCMRDSTPVRPCVIWMDVRAQKEADELLEKTGEFYSAEWMPPKLAWLKRNERENYDRAEVFCEYQDWLTFRLTGSWCMNINTACNWGYSVNDGFSQKVYEALDITDALRKFPTEKVYRVGDRRGALTGEAALQLGLLRGIPVAQGGVDSSIGVLGMGVNRPGRIAMIAGSSNLAMALNTRPLLNPEGSNNGPDNLFRGLYTDYVAQSSTGSVLSWFRREFCRDLTEKGLNAYREMDRLAREVPIGSNGLILLDYFQGNKHPYYDGSVRGMFYGLSLSHTRRDMYRAVLEGVAFGTERMLDAFREKGVAVDELNIAGGTANSPLWLQIHADVSNIKVNVPSDTNATCLGCAIAAAAMLGVYPSLKEAVDRMVTYDRTYLPDPDRHRRYEKVYRLYRRLYPEMKGWMHDARSVFAGLYGIEE